METSKKPWWRWLLLPLSPVAIPVALVYGIVKGIKKGNHEDPESRVPK